MLRQLLHINGFRGHSVVFMAFCGLTLVGCGADDGQWDPAAEESFGSASQALCSVGPLANGLVASASSSENGSLLPQLAIDGAATTRWSSTFSDPQWLQVDLGQPRYIDNLVLAWEAASAADYRIELSSDGSSWTIAKTITGAAPGARTDTVGGLSAHVGRYVRVLGTRRTTPYGYSLFELKVNGDANPACGATSGRDIANNLEAESHDGMAGLQYEATSDVGGGQNAGWIEASDYVQWVINVPKSGGYTVTTRSATWAASSVQLLVDGAVATTLNLPTTWTGSGDRYQTWRSFSTESLNLTAGQHTLRAAFTSPNQNLNWLKVSPSAAASKVEIRTPLVDDFVYLSVNGLRHRVAYWGMDPATAGSWRDISSLFRGGNNDLRVQAANSGGPGGLDIELRVDGGAAIRVACTPPSCDPSTNSQMFIDQAVTLPSLNLPATKALTITSQHSGKIYVNDEYIGLSTPATIQVPSGSYTVGVGVSNDLLGQYTGRFHEKTVTVGSASVSVDLETGGTPLPVRKAVKVGFLPLRTVIGTNLPGPGVLTDRDIEQVQNQIQATNTKWLVPFSYGLSRWEVTRLPTVTDWVGPMDGTCQVLDLPAYAPLLAAYDFVFILHSERDAAGNRFFGGTGGYSVGQCVVVPNTAAESRADDAPNPLVLHEILHQYETNQVVNHHLYNGVLGLHGAPEHGFPETGSQGEPDWSEWYRFFIRGQAGEVASMRPDIHPSAPPVNPSYYVGTFSSIKYGMRSPAPR